MKEAGSVFPLKPCILVVDDDPVCLQVLEVLFEGDYEVILSNSGPDTVEICRQRKPDLVILDIFMPGMGGMEVCRILKADPEMVDIPVIFITGQGTPEEETAALQAGAVDFITKPVNPSVVQARVKTHIMLKVQSDFLKTLVFLDGLTGVANRRRFDEFLDAEWRRGRRNQTPLTLIMIDIDDFKSFNDRYGHQAGDACLRQVALALKNTLRRPQDFTARYGGEEFVCALPETHLAAGRNLAEVLRGAVAELAIPHDVTPGGFVSISLGVACLVPNPEIEMTDLIAMADAKLYQAKRNGKNCVEA